jgi:ACS family sodium-dependent inorganic phosphate cotransporter/ACS family sodium-dependent inorganic phosphate cotransporter-like MFS transporter 9
VGLLVSPFILVSFGWRALFLLFGFLGAPLLAVWNATVPDKPPAAQQLAAASAAAAAGKPAGGGGGGNGVTLGRLLSHPATWAIVVVNFVNHWGYFIYLNWMPTYFSKVIRFAWRQPRRPGPAQARILLTWMHSTLLPGCQRVPLLELPSPRAGPGL